MMNRTKKAFTLLELIVVVVILGILALVAVPSFAGVINNTRGDVAEQTARSIARDANALAAFNDGSATNQTSNANIDTAIGEADLSTDDGWFVSTTAGDGGEIALSKNGSTTRYCIETNTASPVRAVVTLTTGTEGSC